MKTQQATTTPAMKQSAKKLKDTKAMKSEDREGDRLAESQNPRIP